MLEILNIFQHWLMKMTVYIMPRVCILSSETLACLLWMGLSQGETWQLFIGFKHGKAGTWLRWQTPPWLEGFIDLAMEYDKKKIETNLFQLLNIDYIGRPSSLKIAGCWTGQFSKNQWIVWSNQTIHMAKKKSWALNLPQTRGWINGMTRRFDPFWSNIFLKLFYLFLIMMPNPNYFKLMVN